MFTKIVALILVYTRVSTRYFSIVVSQINRAYVYGMTLILVKDAPYKIFMDLQVKYVLILLEKIFL